jgi:tetratricopeptide (TPR) repeat protein
MQMIRYITIILITLSCSPDNSEMKIKDIITNQTDVYIFDIVKEETDNPFDWEIKPRDEKLIPNTEAHCIVRAKMIDSDKKVSDCFVNVSLPERIVDYVIYQTNQGLKYYQTYELADIDVIPAIASEAFGVYELYYSKNNPDIGIEILRQGLEFSKDPSVIAEDLGYILRDLKRYEEALAAFLISEEFGVSSDYIYMEIRDLYIQLNNKDKADEYNEKIKDVI